VADIEKVIKGLGKCSCIYGIRCEECPYVNDDKCVDILCSDALELLKGKEVKVEIEGGGSTWFYVCGECHTSASKHSKYCRECGRMLIWDGRHWDSN